jgi:hypothetical protein
MACMEMLTVHLRWWVGFQQLLPDNERKMQADVLKSTNKYKSS